MAQIKAEDVVEGDKVLRYGMWFKVEEVEKLPAERGGFLYSFSLNPVSRGGRCSLALFPGELITADRGVAGG